MINYPPGLPENTKICFGKHWDAAAPQCCGGLDPTYVNAAGSNARPKCSWFGLCATESVKNNLGTKTRLETQPSPPEPFAPFQSLVRNTQKPAMQQPSAPWAPMQQAPWMPQAQAQVAPMPQAHYSYLMVPPAIATLPQTVPMNYQAPGAQMPAYLTIQEPVVSGQKWWTRLFYNILRSMTKAGAHTTANFVDHTPINRE